MSAVEMTFYLLVGHALADYPLQSDFLAKAKNHAAPVPGIPWQIALVAHSIIHGGFVAAITGSVALGVAETVIHAHIDYAKCAGRTSLATDQLLHVLCKVAWAALVAAGVV